MRGDWLAWRWFTTNGTPGGWSLDHFIPFDAKSALCGVELPSMRKVFDCKSGTGQDRCKKCEKKFLAVRETNGSGA